MEKRTFGRTGRQVPVIGQGTWYIDNAHHATAVAVLKRGLDLGMTHIDTAEMYGNGAAERIVGEAIAGRRDEVFLVSKVLPQHASRKGTISACEKSLVRLKTGYLDCYLLHWPGSHALEETIAGFESLQSAGKILSWGVSNFDAGGLDEIAATSGGQSMACDQVLYHLHERTIEHAVLPWCESHHVALVAYSPFGHANFPSTRSTAGRMLQEIAQAHGATPRQVALQFLLRSPNVFAIPKASSIAHVEENARAGELQLTAAELARIDAVFPRGPAQRSLPML